MGIVAGLGMAYLRCSFHNPGGCCRRVPGLSMTADRDTASFKLGLFVTWVLATKVMTPATGTTPYPSRFLGAHHVSGAFHRHIPWVRRRQI